MRPRYFAMYIGSEEGKLILASRPLGRFSDQEAAEDFAALQRYPGKLDYVRVETRYEAGLYALSCVALRALRLIVAAAIALVGYVFLSDWHIGIGDIPLSQLTLSLIFSALLKTAISIALFFGCWALAFGEGPRDSPFA